MYRDVLHQDRLRDAAVDPLFGETQAVAGGGSAGVARDGVLAAIQFEFLGELAEGQLGRNFGCAWGATLMTPSISLCRPASLIASMHVS